VSPTANVDDVWDAIVAGIAVAGQETLKSIKKFERMLPGS